VKRQPGRVQSLAPLLVALPIVVHAAFVLPQFDGLYGQDPYAYYSYAVGPLRDSLIAGNPLPPFYWPPGYPILVALLSFVVGTAPLAGQLVSVAGGALVAIFTLLLAREVWVTDGDRSPVPWLAGLIAGFAGQLWQSSVVVMADTTGLAAVTLALWALVRYGATAAGSRLGGLPWLASAAAAMAWGILTRWANLIVAVPGAAYGLVALSYRRWRSALLHAAVATAIALAILSPVLGPAFDTLTGTDGDAAVFSVNIAVITWHPLNAFHRTFVHTDGYLEYPRANLLFYGLAPAHRAYFTPLVALFLPLGLWTVLRRRSLPALLIVVGWPALAFVMLVGMPWQNFRFALTFLPPLAIMAAIGVDTAFRAAGKRGKYVVAVLLVGGLLWMAHGGQALTRQFITRKNANVHVVEWVEETIPTRARLLTFSITSAFGQYSRLEALDLYNLDREQIAAMVASDRPTYVLLDVPATQRQWEGRAPWENFVWLRDVAGISEVGELGGYTLYAVDG